MKRAIMRSLAAGLAAISMVFSLAWVGLLPSPSWWSRRHLQKSDTAAMEALFGPPLPKSFALVKTAYPGYSLIFNGPDGPVPAFYLAQIDAADFGTIVKRAKQEHIRFNYLNVGPVFNLAFLKLLTDKERRDRERVSSLDDPPEFDCRTYTNGSIWSFVAIDSGSSPVLHLYIRTQVPYAVNYAREHIGS